MLPKLTIFRKGLILVAVPLFFQLLFVWFVARMQASYAETQASASHSDDVIEQTHSLLAAIVDVETASRGYVITARPEIVASYEHSTSRIARNLERLSNLVRENPAQHERVQRLGAATSSLLAWHAENNRLVAAGHPASAIARATSLQGKEHMDDVRSRVDRLLAEQRLLARERAQALAASRTSMYRLLWGGVLASLASSIVLAAIFSRGISSRIATLADNARRLARGDTLAQPIRGDDEIADLDLVFHRMAEEIVQSNRAAREQSHLLQLVLDSMSDPVMVADERGKFLLVNQAAQWIHAEGDAEVPPENWSQHYGAYLPDKTTYFPTDELPLVRAMRGEHVDGLELYLRPPGAAEGAWLNINARPLEDPDGSVRGGVVVCRDVTAQKLADEQIRALLEAAPDGMVIVDQTGSIVRVNAQTERLFGFTRQELLGRKIEFLIPERYRMGHVAHRDGYLTDPHLRPMGVMLDAYGRRKDNSEFPVEIALSPLHTEQGLLVSAAVRDVTARKEAEDAIRRLNDELEDRVAARTADLAAANRELAERSQENETFVYSVSHDLRSPLVNLQGFSKELGLACQDLREILATSGLNADAKQRSLRVIDGDMAESVRFVQSAVVRLSNIIDALLRLSRARRVEYQLVAVNVPIIVARVVDALSGTVNERGAQIEVDPLPWTLGDPSAIEQVFANLIGNALCYLDPARPGRIEIGCLSDLAPGGPAGSIGLQTFYVRDNGLGIPEPYQAKVFQAFQRVHPEAAPGEGMGLAIVQRIVERHSGRVWFESEEGAGTTFFVSLPAAPNRAAPTAVDRSPVLSPAGDA